ncbi:MAG: hypothetical protein JNM94_16730 [Phycisphaerae bacterium]|nr:hypothetical protein [Phycisphaerae bacterium]
MTTTRMTSIAVLLSAIAATAAAEPPAKGTVAARDATMTVYPTFLVGKPSTQVGEVVGMMLERGGMTHLTVAADPYVPPTGADWPATSADFAAFVKTHPIATDYALFTEFRGTPKSGCDAVRIAVADRAGTIVWSDVQDAGDAIFDRVKPREPMQCCIVAAEALRPAFSLGDPNAAGAPEGPIAKSWAKASGVPDEAERKAIATRAAAFAKAPATTSVVLFPPQVNGTAGTSAADLVARVNDAKAFAATAGAPVPPFAVEPTPNEQKLLWTVAREFAAHVKAHPPKDAAYAVLANYLMGTLADGTPVVGGVHTIVVDREGNLVVVDCQNSHQKDFREINPTTVEGCDRLVARRLVAARK